jgi:BASS family bile acid:Na+ symporter
MMLRGLALLGRHGTWFLAGGLFIGVLVPPLARLLHPALGVFIFVLTATSLLAIDWPALAAHARRPGLLALVLAWTLLAVPVLVALAVRALGLAEPLAQALVLWAASPPLTSLPAIALLLGLDGALALLAMVGGTFLVPLTLPPLVLGLIGLKLGIDIPSLMLRLTLFIGGAALTAVALRRLIGGARLRRHALALSGFNVLILLAFAIAVMDGANDLILAQPQQVLRYAGAALAANLALQAVSFLAFAWLPRLPALTVALTGGNNNLGVVWANLGGAVTPELALFFAAAQLPIFVLPAALKPAYRRLGAGEPHGRAPGTGSV